MNARNTIAAGDDVLPFRSPTLMQVCVCPRFNDYLDRRFFVREKSRILSVKRYSLIVIVITRSRYPISAFETKCSRLHHLFFAHAHTLTHRAYALKGQQTYLNGGPLLLRKRAHTYTSKYSRWKNENSAQDNTPDRIRRPCVWWCACLTLSIL